MTREEALSILKDLRPTLQDRFGVARLGLFGSIVRAKEGPIGDVDVVVEMPPDLFAMVHLKEGFEAAFHSPVDLVRYRPRMNTFLRERIDREAVYV